MTRTIAENDLRLIHRYFPGAQRIHARTPFDLGGPESPWLRADDCDELAAVRWLGDTL
jgi:hypothetical protein